MSDLKKFWLRLKDHPGIEVVLLMHAVGFIAGLNRNDGDIKTAFIAAAVMSVFWIPVLLTSWTNRNEP